MIFNRQAILLALQVGRDRVASGWCQGDWAKDKYGQSAWNFSTSQLTEITAWCAWGAVEFFDSEVKVAARLELARTLRERRTEECSLVWWNDIPGRTQADVLTLYDDTVVRVQNELSQPA